MQLTSLPAIDIRACVFAVNPQEQPDDHSLFGDITNRLLATATLCAETLGLSLLQATINWNTMSKQGVQVALSTPSSTEIPLFIPWGSIENEASILHYIKGITQPLAYAA